MVGKNLMANKNDYGVSYKETIKTMITGGHWGSIFLYFAKRLYSKGQFYILRRDLALPIEKVDNDIHLTFRRLRKDDISALIKLDYSYFKDAGPLDRLRLLKMLGSDFRNCYVTAIDNDIPCHVCWIIDSSENEKLFNFFHGGIPPLNADEVLIEGSFTLENYRRKGIQSWSIHKLIEKSAELGARWAYAYVRPLNKYSLKSFNKNCFVPYMIRNDTWLMLRRAFTFITLSADSIIL